MRIPLRTKVTLTLVAFGLIPAGIVAAFAYMSAQDFMGRQTQMISAAAASISDHAKMLILKNYELDHKAEKAATERGDKAAADNPPPLKWELTDADREDLQRHISYMLRNHNLARAYAPLFQGLRTTFSCVFEGFLRKLSRNYIITTNCDALYSPITYRKVATM